MRRRDVTARVALLRATHRLRTRIRNKWQTSSARSVRFRSARRIADGVDAGRLLTSADCVGATYSRRPSFILMRFILLRWWMLYFPRRRGFVRPLVRMIRDRSPIPRSRRPSARPSIRPPAADPADRPGCTDLRWMAGACRPCAIRAHRGDREAEYATSREDGGGITPLRHT